MKTDQIISIYAAWLVIVALGFAARTVAEKDETRLSIMDCVNNHWVEFENRTGKMPPRQMEIGWYDDCIEEIEIASR